MHIFRNSLSNLIKFVYMYRFKLKMYSVVVLGTKKTSPPPHTCNYWVSEEERGPSGINA